MSILDRLNAAAQRLDELSEEGPDELTTLAEDLIAIAGDVERALLPNAAGCMVGVPEYLVEIQRIVERAAHEIEGRRFALGAYPNVYDHLTIPNPYVNTPPSLSRAGGVA